MTLPAAGISIIDITGRPFPVTAALAAQGKPNTVALTPEVNELLARDCVVAVGVSGGKDSDACAIATHHHLNKIGHKGPRVLIHADLGLVEWEQSLPGCRRLAALLGWELMVVSRKAGGLMERWESRWDNNVARYQDLACVKLILPWSTPGMRFCTSELKSDAISANLRKAFPGQDILNVTGIRRQESATRAKMAVSGVLPKLQRKNAAGVSWNPIIEWPVEDVVHAIITSGLNLHEAYTVYGTSRVSCSSCIMSSLPDLLASTQCPSNQPAYVRICALEVKSSFGFQGNRWLSDVAPHLLPEALRAQVAESKRIAIERVEAEDLLAGHLLYSKGWPDALPTMDEAQLIAKVRRKVSDLLALNAGYLTAESVRDRYAYLLEQKAQGISVQKATRRAA